MGSSAGSPLLRTQIITQCVNPSWNQILEVPRGCLVVGAEMMMVGRANDIFWVGLACISHDGSMGSWDCYICIEVLIKINEMQVDTPYMDHMGIII